MDFCQQNNLWFLICCLGLSWNSSSLATSCEELTHWKRPWCSEGLEAGGEGDDRGWDGWMASPTQWTWVWVDSGSWWWTGRPGVLRFMGSQSQTQLSDWTELNWTEWKPGILVVRPPGARGKVPLALPPTESKNVSRRQKLKTITNFIRDTA